VDNAWKQKKPKATLARNACKSPSQSALALLAIPLVGRIILVMFRGAMLGSLHLLERTWYLTHYSLLAISSTRDGSYWTMGLYHPVFPKIALAGTDIPTTKRIAPMINVMLLGVGSKYPVMILYPIKPPHIRVPAIKRANQDHFSPFL